MAQQVTQEVTAEDLGFEPISVHTSAAFSLLRVSALLSDEMDRELQEQAGMGLSEMLVLVQLMLAGGRFKMADLAEALVVTRGGVTKIIDRMVGAGLVERVPSASDRRVIYAQLTESAKQKVRDNQHIFDGVANAGSVSCSAVQKWNRWRRWSTGCPVRTQVGSHQTSISCAPAEDRSGEPLRGRRQHK